MNQSNQVPDDCKKEPGQKEGCGEPEYCPDPGELDETCEEILDIPAHLQHNCVLCLVNMINILFKRVSEAKKLL